MEGSDVTIREIPRHEAAQPTSTPGATATRKAKWSLGAGLGFSPFTQVNSRAAAGLLGSLTFSPQPPEVTASIVVERELTDQFRLGAGLNGTSESSRGEGFSSQGRGFGASVSGRYFFNSSEARVRPSGSLSLNFGSAGAFGESNRAVVSATAEDVINRVFIDELFFGAGLGFAVDGRLLDFLVLRLGASVAQAQFSSRTTTYQAEPQQPANPDRTVKSDANSIGLSIQPGIELRIEF